MNCPECGAEASEGATYCAACGAAIDERADGQDGSGEGNGGQQPAEETGQQSRETADASNSPRQQGRTDHRTQSQSPQPQRPGQQTGRPAQQQPGRQQQPQSQRQGQPQPGQQRQPQPQQPGRPQPGQPQQQQPGHRQGQPPDGRQQVGLSNAEGVDIACQHCGKRPIQEVMKGYRVTGFLLAYQLKTYKLVGCHSCLRSKVWGMAGKNLVFGWWSIAGLLLTPLFTVYDFARGLYNRGPNSNLTQVLDEAGITYEFLASADQFDPREHTPMELYLRGMIRLSVAVMLADGQADPEEREAIHDAVEEVFPSYPESKVDDLIERSMTAPGNVASIAEGLGDMLTPEGKQLVIAFVGRVADAGVQTPADVELASQIATAMDLDESAVREALEKEELLSTINSR